MPSRMSLSIPPPTAVVTPGPPLPSRSRRCLMATRAPEGRKGHGTDYFDDKKIEIFDSIIRSPANGYSR